MKHREKKTEKKKELSFNYLWKNFKPSNMMVIEISEREENRKLFAEITPPNLMKII